MTPSELRQALTEEVDDDFDDFDDDIVIQECFRLLTVAAMKLLASGSPENIRLAKEIQETLEYLETT